jgi:hypothetical protein
MGERAGCLRIMMREAADEKNREKISGVSPGREEKDAF